MTSAKQTISPVRVVKKNGIRVEVYEDAEAVSAAAAAMIAGRITASSKFNLGLATGSTPIKTYDELVRIHEAGELTFSHVTSFNLDEYVNLPPTHDQSYRYFMMKHLLDRVDIPLYNTFVLNGQAVDVDAECSAFEGLIKARGGVDLWLLGIGGNGHIGFNEPGSAVDSRTRVVTLDDCTRADNARFFATLDDVPTHAVSAGVQTITDSHAVLLLATGAGKANAVAAAVAGDCSVDCPASLLQGHDDTTFMVDVQAAKML